jgi:hypothetical protein
MPKPRYIGYLDRNTVAANNPFIVAGNILLSSHQNIFQAAKACNAARRKVDRDAFIYYYENHRWWRV